MMLLNQALFRQKGQKTLLNTHMHVVIHLYKLLVETYELRSYRATDISIISCAVFIAIIQWFHGTIPTTRLNRLVCKMFFDYSQVQKPLRFQCVT